jgi:hypothetical protein
VVRLPASHHAAAVELITAQLHALHQHAAEAEHHTPTVACAAKSNRAFSAPISPIPPSSDPFNLACFVQRDVLAISTDEVQHTNSNSRNKRQQIATVLLQLDDAWSVYSACG